MLASEFSLMIMIRIKVLIDIRNIFNIADSLKRILRGCAFIFVVLLFLFIFSDMPIWLMSIRGGLSINANRGSFDY